MSRELMKQQIDQAQAAAEEQLHQHQQKQLFGLVEFLADFAAGFEAAGVETPEQKEWLATYKGWKELVQDLGVAAGLAKHTDYMSDEERNERDAYFLAMMNDLPADDFELDL